MDEFDFRRLLNLFPVVRSRDYCQGDLEIFGQSTSHTAQSEVEQQDAREEGDKRENEIQGFGLHGSFWEKLKLAAEKKVGAAAAEEFCKAFHRIHKKLVFEGLSLNSARSFVNSGSSGR